MSIEVFLRAVNEESYDEEEVNFKTYVRCISELLLGTYKPAPMNKLEQIFGPFELKNLFKIN